MSFRNRSKNFTKKNFKLLLISSLLTLLVIGGVFVIRTSAQTTNTTYFTGCLGVSKGDFYNFNLGSTPLKTCKSGDTQVNWNNASYSAGQGLVLDGSQFSITDQGITTSKIADKAVVSQKMSPTILMGERGGPFVATSNSMVDVPDTNVVLTVPPGNTFDTVVTISGIGSMNGNVDYYILSINRDGADIRTWGIGTNGFDVATPFSFTIKDSGLTGGAHTYKIRVANISINEQTTIQKTSIVVQAFASQ